MCSEVPCTSSSMEQSNDSAVLHGSSARLFPVGSISPSNCSDDFVLYYCCTYCLVPLYFNSGFADSGLGQDSSFIEEATDAQLMGGMITEKCLRPSDSTQIQSTPAKQTIAPIRLHAKQGRWVIATSNGAELSGTYDSATCQNTGGAWPFFLSCIYTFRWLSSWANTTEPAETNSSTDSTSC